MAKTYYAAKGTLTANGRDIEIKSAEMVFHDDAIHTLYVQEPLKVTGEINGTMEIKHRYSRRKRQRKKNIKKAWRNVSRQLAFVSVGYSVGELTQD